MWSTSLVWGCEGWYILIIHINSDKGGIFQCRPVLIRRVNPSPPEDNSAGGRADGLFGLSWPGLAWPGLFGFGRPERKGKERKRKGKARPDISNFNENLALKIRIC